MRYFEVRKDGMRHDHVEAETCLCRIMDNVKYRLFVDRQVTDLEEGAYPSLSSVPDD